MEAYGNDEAESCKAVVAVLEGIGLVNRVEDVNGGEGCFVPIMQCYGLDSPDMTTAEESNAFQSSFESDSVVRAMMATCAGEGGGPYERGGMIVCIVRRVQAVALLQLLVRMQSMDASTEWPRMWIPPPVEEAVGAVQKGKPAAIVTSKEVRVMMIVARREDVAPSYRKSTSTLRCCAKSTLRASGGGTTQASSWRCKCEEEKLSSARHRWCMRHWTECEQWWRRCVGGVCERQNGTERAVALIRHPTARAMRFGRSKERRKCALCATTHRSG